MTADPKPRLLDGPWGLVFLVAILVATSIATLAWMARVNEKLAAAACDHLYVAMMGERTGEVDEPALQVQRECFSLPPAAVRDCMLGLRRDELNPRNRSQPAYTAALPESCQVQITPLSTNGLTLSQSPKPGKALRTYSIRMD